MLNKVMLIGRLGRDPELRYTMNGTPVTTLNLATDESYIDRDGNRVDRTEWHRVSVFQRQAENCANFLSKGSLVYVEGSLQTRKWTDSQGQERYTTDVKAQRVQFLEKRSNNMMDNNVRAEEGYAPRDPMMAAAPQQRPYPPRPTTAPNRPQARMQDPMSQKEDLGPAFPSEAATMDEVPF